MLAHNLPAHATRFIGRESEVNHIRNLICDPTYPLLTIVGSGGIGKTRLSTEVIRQLSIQSDGLFPDGIYFVPLASLTSASNIALAISNALDIHLNNTGTHDEQLINYLRDRQMLLVLDNFEHVMEGVSLLSNLMDVAEHIKLLVTSRERLHLADEQIYSLQGMTTPETDQVDSIADFDALLLFQQIAEKVDWRFTITDDEKPYVIRICQLVDGMPLAIELAAAWVRVLSCETIQQELTHSFEFLGDSLTHIPVRHRSLRVVFEYSWNLLTDKERDIFQSLAVFRGGFTREASEQIAGAKITSLLSLVDKSLIQHGTRERYYIHEQLRQFAGEKLANNPEHVSETHNLHSEYYADFLFNHTTGFTVLENRDLPVVISIGAELDNIRVMWDWAIAQQQFSVLNRASDSLYHYYRLCESCGEATDAFRKAITIVEAAEPFQDQDKLLAKLLSMLAYHAKFYSLDDFAQDVAQRGLSLAHKHNVPDAQARCLVILGDNAIDLGLNEDARQYLEESIEIYAALGETYEDQYPGLLLSLSYRNLGEYELARQHYRKMITTSKQRKADSHVAWALSHLGYLNNFLGNYTLGQQQNNEAKEIFERQGMLMGVLAANKNLASSYCGLGQYDMARHHFHIALSTYIKRGSQLKGLALKILLGIANLLALQGDVIRAVEMATFIQHNRHANSETKMIASTLLDELQAEIQPEVFQLGQDHAQYLELESLVINFIDEFTTTYEDTNQTETVSESELELLQQVTDSLASGRLLNDNLSDAEQRHVNSLMTTVDDILEREKAKLMSTFIGSASHDLRTPLTIINTSLYLLNMINDPDKQKERLSLIKEQVDHLHTLIENLVDMARYDSGIDLTVTSLDLHQLMDNIQQTYIPDLIADRDLDVQFVFPDQPLMMMADREQLRQALLNIIENAIFYTPDGGMVTVRAASDMNKITIDVQDTGMGIAEEDLPHIFERFYQVDKARTERGRAGLGLAIAQKIIEAHKGEISASSIVGEGSLFRITLPQAD